VWKCRKSRKSLYTQAMVAFHIALLICPTWGPVIVWWDPFLAIFLTARSVLLRNSPVQPRTLGYVILSFRRWFTDSDTPGAGRVFIFIWNKNRERATLQFHKFGRRLLFACLSLPSWAQCITDNDCLRTTTPDADIKSSPVWDIFCIINEVCSNQSYLKILFQPPSTVNSWRHT